MLYTLGRRWSDFGSGRISDSVEVGIGPDLRFSRSMDSAGVRIHPDFGFDIRPAGRCPA